jgi:transcriptional regulator with XRE-family HTH domain
MSRKARFNNPPVVVRPVPEGVDLAPQALSRQEFGRRLYALMLERNWNQSELARQADLGRDAVSGYVRGRQFPEPKSLEKLAKALHMKPQDLLPNAAMRAIDSEVPAFEMKQAAGHPDKVWLRVNRMVSITQAAQVFAVLNPKDEPSQ